MTQLKDDKIMKQNKVIERTRIIIGHLKINNLLKWMPDKPFLKLKFKYMMGVKLNIENPQTFNEKLQWLKLYDRNPLYTELVDKLEVRKYIEDTIGKEYLIPLLGSWEKFDDINFSNLPNQFVLKTTHDSGGVVICKDKKNFNISEARKKLNKSLARNYYYTGREWPYKDIKPKIICEALIKTDNGELPNDYKFHCFNGKVDNVMVCTARETGSPRFYFFDDEWNLLKYNITGKNAPENFTLDRPKGTDRMFEIAKKLSLNLPFVRVDLYCEEGRIFFGEFTFYPESGFDTNLLSDTDKKFGEKIILDKQKK